MNKRKSKPVSFWSELMMLREKGMFRKCRRPDVEDFVFGCTWPFALFLLAAISTFGLRALAHIGYAIGVYILLYSLSLAVIPVLTSRKSILRPAYYQRELANAQVEFDLAMRELETSLPVTKYRIAPTEDLQASTERLRAYADNNQLSADQRSRLARVETAKERLDEAERAIQSLAEPANPEEDNSPSPKSNTACTGV